MNQNVFFRVTLDIAMILAVFFGWWPVALLIGVIGLFKYSYYVEFIAAGFAFDALFGMNAGTLIGFMAAHAGILVATGISCLVWAVKGSLR